MKKQFYILWIVLTVLACTSNHTTDRQNISSSLVSEIPKPQSHKGSTKPAALFTLSDAEKIFGESAYLEDSSTTKNGKVLIYQCEYQFNSQDKKNRSVYFMFEDYKDISDAKQTYSFIKSANQKLGIHTLENVGDEAYFHTDNENFYFILARKNNKVMRMKVNRITDHTSLEEFNKVTKNIVAIM